VTGAISLKVFDPSRTTLRVRKDNGDIDAITAATITARAYCDAIQRAYDTFMPIIYFHKPNKRRSGIMKQWKNFTKGFIKDNPVFILLLGLCPALGVTTSAFNGLGMGLATTFVLWDQYTWFPLSKM
jgi:hypothetical protein